MANHTLITNSLIITMKTDFSDIGRPGTLLKYRTVEETLSEFNRFNRWAENERGRHYRDYL